MFNYTWQCSWDDRCNLFKFYILLKRIEFRIFEFRVCFFVSRIILFLSIVRSVPVFSSPRATNSIFLSSQYSWAISYTTVSIRICWLFRCRISLWIRIYIFWCNNRAIIINILLFTISIISRKYLLCLYMCIWIKHNKWI